MNYLFPSLVGTVGILILRKLGRDHLSLKSSENDHYTQDDNDMMAQKLLEGASYADPLRKGNPAFFNAVGVTQRYGEANKKAEYEVDSIVINNDLLNKKQHISKEAQDSRAAVMALTETSQFMDPWHTQQIIAGRSRAVRLWNPEIVDCIGA